ncbi:hypothetical protein [Actinomyces johnsonii]|nr:hypothetical protein [Actinomyces johnsonii]
MSVPAVIARRTVLRYKAAPKASLQLTGLRPQSLSPHRHTFAPCPP